MDVTIQTQFNTMGFGGRYVEMGKLEYDIEYDEKWISSRIDILIKYLLPSLIKQSDQNFNYILLVRKETKEFIIDLLNNKNVLENKFFHVATPEEKFELCDKIITTDRFHEVRLDSDNCYRIDFVEKLKSLDINAHTEAVVLPRGYMWYLENNVIVEREFKSPGFYSLIYKKDEYLSGKQHETPGGHDGVITLNHKKIEDRTWLWTVHDLNFKILRGKGYPDYKKFTRVGHKILKEFGI